MAKTYTCSECGDTEVFETAQKADAAGLSYRPEYKEVMCDACHQFAQEADEDWEANKADAIDCGYTRYGFSR